jgi:hypothetical protein
MVGTITWETKKEGQRKAKCIAYKNQKKRERINPFCGRKLFHPWPF